MTLTEKDDVFAPKHHILFHLLHRCEHLGNPRFYSTWRSEAMNKVLKSACRQVSQITFEPTVLLKMKHLLAQQLKQDEP